VSEDEAHDFALLQLELQAMTTNRDDWRRTAEMCAEECSEAWTAAELARSRVGTERPPRRELC
jgi:hypothetical protein